MIDLRLHFETITNLLLYGSTLVFICWWVYYRFVRSASVSLVPFIAIGITCYLAWTLLAGIGHDEGEHLHCSWMVAQGLIPYRDFWQHHGLMEWLILAPLFTLRVMPHSAWMIYVARLIATLILTLQCALGWRIARTVFGKSASLPLYLLVFFCAATNGEFAYLRPDTFQALGIMAGLYAYIAGERNRNRSLFLCGVAFAISMSFVFKQFFILFLPVIGALLERGSFRSKMYRLLLYGVGLCIGSIPLVSYLYSHGIVREFFYWVLEFNRQRFFLTATLPLGIALVSGWGALLLWRKSRGGGDSRSALLLLAFGVSTISALLTTLTYGSYYYIGPWLLLASTVAAGCPLAEIARARVFTMRRVLAVGGCIGLLMASTIVSAKIHKRSSFREDSKMMNRLIQLCQNETCLIFLPYHPIVVNDATRLYSDWQYYFLDRYPAVNKDLGKDAFARQIITNRPAVISYRNRRNELFADLFLKGALSKDGYQKLMSFVSSNYTSRYVGPIKYYLRNDKL